MDKNEVVTEDQQVIDCLWPEQLNRIECNLSRACNAIAVNLSKKSDTLRSYQSNQYCAVVVVGHGKCQ